ncbi:MAG: putative holin-like toxin [Roseburia faecis]|nr:putative holin-like toxin [Roseburia faecis]MCB5477628.1 putative holin-like toxin [Roseburia faecis]MCG4784795.1 putative holin-like toxin [Roseburia faecis]MED9949591.1 putative holin-like toxin [Roseburia faecis]
MVTYSELFQFCILIVAIINLIVMIFFNHKK